ncbi:MFS transporter [Streptomyces sp. NPDC054949]|uniref:MFS transporter n=1 Tax=unclassified Streptomyces TaxID=2593676 RepID=UPI0006AF65E9|nr:MULTISPECIES: MFS transporter [unclassified Streptomyces]MCX5076762.1 MFS transporter [Streptomyces sp. NBC_00424]MCX5156803.1 MFS transporter [Streptomyces sp. NBC_00291]WUD40222.1 MFS transporter [Streptomyces sp. NBC_00513]
MTTLDSSAPRTAGKEPSAVKGWLAVLAVTLGIFSLMTSELLPVGLLTPVGDALKVSEGTAALMVTIPGLVAAISAPLVTVATGKFDRRLVLVILIAIVGLANLASAFATSFAVVLVARFLIGISVGGFWSIAGGIALRLVPERHVARATAVIFGGVETASVLGVPTGTFLGDLSGWRTAFAAVGILGLVALAAMLFLMPKVPAERTIVFGDLPRVWKSNAGVRIGIAMTFLVITGHFLAYTFVRPLLQDDGVGDNMIGVLLLTFGIAGITGNFIAGALIAKRLRQVVIGIAIVLAVAMLLLATVGNTTVTAAVILVLWGLGYGAVPVTFQTWILDAAPDATEAASSLYVSTFNLSIALGALFGGIAVDNLATASVLYIGAGLAILTLLVVGRRSGRPTDSAPAAEPATDPATAAAH